MAAATPSTGPADVLKPTPAELLFDQYKLLEERRKYFGSQFMQTLGGVGAVFAFLVSQLGGKKENSELLAFVLIFGGLAFMLLALLAYRLGSRQDDCEKVMRKIEGSLCSMKYPIEEMPPGAKIGARILIVACLGGFGISLVVFGIRGL